MKALLRLGWRGLSRNWRFSLLFIVNLALGLAGFLLIGSFSASLARHLDVHLREILTADLILQTSRPLTEKEIDISRRIAGPDSQFSRQVAFYSMIRGGGVAKLTRIVAIDQAYPLYGAFRDGDAPLPPARIEELQRQRHALMSRETARSLGLALGDTLDIGQTGYTLSSFFDREPGGDFTSLALAPTLYVGLSNLRDSGLIRFGSRVSYKFCIRLSEKADSAAVAVRLNAALAGPAATTPEIRISTTADINRRLSRVTKYFSSFLGLASLVSLALAGLAAAFLFREHLRGRAQEIAVLLSLGASHRHCLLLAMGQLALLGLAAAWASVTLTWLLLPLFTRLFVGIVPTGLQLSIDPLTAVLALLVGAVGSLLFCLPVYLRILAMRPLALLQEQFDADRNARTRRWRTFLTLVPTLAPLLFLAAYLSPTTLQGIAFTGGMVVLIIFFTLIARLLFSSCRRWSHTSHLTWRIVWRNLYRNRRSATAVFVALATALLLVNLIPQLEKGLAAEIGQPEGMEQPDLFLIDIQTEQRQPLALFFQDQEGVLSTPAPMVQGRIVSINGQPFTQWRQQHQSGEDWGLRRTEFNFSSREQLDASETVAKGLPLDATPWLANSNQPFAISMEREFSERLQVGIGDRMVIDIQGLELEGQIVNLRKVRWNSFQPNFFMLVQTGVLDDAPKTYLASVSRVEKEKKVELVNRLTTAFPNISVIDVAAMVDQLLNIATQLTNSLRFMAGLALATGLVTVVSIARQEALRREREINLLRVLGAGLGRIRTIVILEFAVVGATAALTALLLSTVCSLGLAWLMFDRTWQFQWQSGTFLLAAATLLCSLTALLATDSVIRRKPLALLG